ncbi:spermidine/putrescine transport system permease protein [Rhodoligotrophos appendicifer]|uniref:ABC transporter permease n=1 Tax=Rhodoligotrophos appendicifer TaxID=987056 RepID=UPI00118512F0|nr:ABC transporter permease [Rhodoligotrophos appendicifer]
MQSHRLRSILLSAPLLTLYIAGLLVPLCILARYSLAANINMRTSFVWTFANYTKIFTGDLYLPLLMKSLGIGALVTIICLLVGYPAAWIIARANEKRRTMLLLLLLLPWWASYIVRVFAFYTLFGNSGVLNKTAQLLGLSEETIGIFTFGLPALIVTELNLFLPLTVIPIYLSLEKLDWNLVLAARSLGAGPVYAFLRVVLPWSLPGVIAGAIFVFMPVAGTYVVPELVGGTSGIMIGRVIATQFGASSNWSFGSALAIILLVVLLLTLTLLTRVRSKFSGQQG